MGVGRLSRLLRGMGVLGIPDGKLNTMQHIESVCEVVLDAAVLQLLVHSMAVGAFIDCRCVADRVKVSH